MGLARSGLWAKAKEGASKPAPRPAATARRDGEKEISMRSSCKSRIKSAPFWGVSLGRPAREKFPASELALQGNAPGAADARQGAQIGVSICIGGEIALIAEVIDIHFGLLIAVTQKAGQVHQGVSRKDNRIGH